MADQGGDLTQLIIRTTFQDIEKTIRLEASQFQRFTVSHQIGVGEYRDTGLAGSHTFSRSPEFQVHLGDSETVVGLAHDLQAALHFRVVSYVRNQNAQRLRGAASYTAS